MWINHARPITVIESTRLDHRGNFWASLGNTWLEQFGQFLISPIKIFFWWLLRSGYVQLLAQPYYLV
jgi:hypothetical protein